MALLTTILLAIFVVPPRPPEHPPRLGHLDRTSDRDEDDPPRRRRAVVGAEAMIGAEAVALGDGWVRVGGERWRARAEARLAAGDPVEVVAVEGLTVVVRRR